MRCATSTATTTSDSVITLGGFRSSDPELFELTTPFLLRRYGYLTDSAGAGTTRGGLGILAEFEIQADGLGCVDWGSGALPETAARGPARRRSTASRTTTRSRTLTARRSSRGRTSSCPLERGTTSSASSPAGAVGTAIRCSAPRRSVEEDVRQAYVSAEAARADYGVALSAAGTSTSRRRPVCAQGPARERRPRGSRRDERQPPARRDLRAATRTPRSPSSTASSLRSSRSTTSTATWPRRC